MYLGEIVRRVLVKMAKVSDLFGNSFPDRLAIPFVLRQVLLFRLPILHCYHITCHIMFYSIYNTYKSNCRTPHLCAMQQDSSDDLGEVKLILNDIIGVSYKLLVFRHKDICMLRWCQYLAMKLVAHKLGKFR